MIAKHLTAVDLPLKGVGMERLNGELFPIPDRGPGNHAGSKNALVPGREIKGNAQGVVAALKGVCGIDSYIIVCYIFYTKSSPPRY